MKFNLIYHIYAPKENQTWKKNIEYLKRYIHIFNNKKIVNIATGAGLASPEEIKKHWNDPTIEFMETPNDPDLREVASFQKLLEAVFSLDSKECTFYAHTKGTTHGRHDCSKPIQLWYEHMYKYNLQDPQMIESILKNAPCCGCFKHNAAWKYCPNPEANWYYSGTFFWCNHAKLFTKNWQNIDQNRWGVEMYLYKFFSKEEAACVFFNGPDNREFSLYGMHDWWFTVSLYTYFALWKRPRILKVIVQLGYMPYKIKFAIQRNARRIMHWIQKIFS